MRPEYNELVNLVTKAKSANMMTKASLAMEATEKAVRLTGMLILKVEQLEKELANGNTK